MEELLEILQGMHPEIDFESCETLIDDDILDSFDIVSLISDISDTYDIQYRRTVLLRRTLIVHPRFMHWLKDCRTGNKKCYLHRLNFLYCCFFWD